MFGLGTLVNSAAIIVGGLFGLLCGRLLPEQAQKALMTACGLCVIFIGIEGTLVKGITIVNGQLQSKGTLMMVGSFAIGTLAGELLNIEKSIECFGEWLKRKTGSSDDKCFIHAFVTASLTVSVGAMAIVGAIADGISGDCSILFVKSILDFVIIMIMAAAMGKGCVFSAIPVAIIQFSVTAFAFLISPLLTQHALDNLSLTGSMIIFCVGVNLVWHVHIRVANMLPVLLISMLWPA